MTTAVAPSDGGDDKALARMVDVQRRRRTDALTVALTSIAVGQLMFASFAFGHSRGPLRLSWTELAAGMLGAILVALLGAGWFARRRLKKSAQWRAKLKEGVKKRKVAVFSDHTTIDDEIVLPETVQKAAIENGVLLLRYRDPRVGGPVLRELSGPKLDLERLAKALSVVPNEEHARPGGPDA